MNEPELRKSIASLLSCTFSRSGGPGGQNVNKVNTRVRATIDIQELQGITERERLRISEKLSNRIDQEGNLSLFVDTERTQLRNRDIAYERMVSLILSAARIPKQRIPTKATKSSKVKRLEIKRIRSSIKEGRSRLSEEE